MQLSSISCKWLHSDECWTALVHLFPGREAAEIEPKALCNTSSFRRSLSYSRGMFIILPCFIWRNINWNTADWIESRHKQRTAGAASALSHRPQVFPQGTLRFVTRQCIITDPNLPWLFMQWWQNALSSGLLKQQMCHRDAKDLKWLHNMIRVSLKNTHTLLTFHTSNQRKELR